MKTLWQDFRYALRMLAKNPGFVAVAAVILALGIGANTAIFSVTNALLLQPLRSGIPERFVSLNSKNESRGLNYEPVSPPDLLNWQAQNHVFEDMTAFQWESFVLAEGDEPESVRGARVSSTFFDFLGVNLVLGRLFGPNEEQPGRDDVAIISHGLWDRKFGSDKDLLGKTLKLSGRFCTVIGITAAEVVFPFGIELDVFLPLALTAGQLSDAERGSRFLTVWAHLKPGVSLQQARAEMDTIAARLEQEYPKANEGYGVRVVRPRDQMVEQVGPVFLLLFLGAGFVLLIACTDVAHLFLARAAARQKEVAIRTALGAGRFRVIRQLLTETTLIALIGGAAGLLVAHWLGQIIASSFPFTQKVGMDAGMLAFALILSLLTGVFFGSAPAFQLSRVNINETLKEGSTRASTGSRRKRLREAMVVSQIALSTVLLVGAGLMVKGFLELQKTNLGFETGSLLTMRIEFPESLRSAHRQSQSGRYGSPEQRRAFFQSVADRVGALPGVESVAAASGLPITSRDTRYFEIAGREYGPGERPTSQYRAVNAGYLQTLNIPVKSGRFFTEQDVEGSEAVAVINETLARRYFPNEDPIGQVLILSDAVGGQHLPVPREPRRIVGITGDVREWGPLQPYQPLFLTPYRQHPLPFLQLALRSTSDPASVTKAVRSENRSIDKEVLLMGIHTMDEVVSQYLSGRRFVASLVTGIGALALLLAAVGTYAVMAHAVVQRKQEIGIRMAVGAHSRDVLRMMVAQGSWLAGGGLVLGAAGAIGLLRLVEHLMPAEAYRILIGVSSVDTLTVAVVLTLISAVALLATYLPARRATRADPMVALRYE